MQTARLVSTSLLAFVVTFALSGCGSKQSSNSPAGTSPQAGSRGATYLYVGVPIVPAIRGYKVDVDAASLTEVPGSPFPHSGSGPGEVIVNNDYLYVTSTDLTTLGGAPFPSGTYTAWVYHADATSGILAQVQAFTLPIGGSLFLEPDGHDLYEINGSEILTLAINPDGTLTDTGSKITLPWPIGSFAISPNGKLMYTTVTTGGGCGKTSTQCPAPDVIWEIDRDPATGDLTPNHQVSGTTNLHLTNLEFDASGHYLLGLTSPLKQIAVESVNDSTGDLTPVPGSPFPSTAVPTGDFTRAFAIDPSGKFVYAMDRAEGNSNAGYLSVFSLSQTAGTLTPVQTFDLPPGDPIALVVDPSLVFLVNSYVNDQPAGQFTPANIDVFKRKPTTGNLSVGGSPVIMEDRKGLQNAAVMHAQ